MPRYFFDFRDDDRDPSLDDHGSDLPTAEDAKSEAIKRLLVCGSKILAEQAQHAVTVYVRDGNTLLFEATLSLQVRDMEAFGEL